MAAPNNASPFPYPMRGLGVIAIFLILAPPVLGFVEGFMMHDWVGGRQVLNEIVDVIGQAFSSRVLPSYSVNMPAVFLAAVWSAYQPAKGGGLSITAAIGHMIVMGLAFEAIFQGIIVSMGGAVALEKIAMGLVQWIAAGWISWILCTGFRLDKPVA